MRSAVTRAAAAPSANSRKLSIFGTFWKSSCRWRLESSRLTTSTRDAGSARTIWSASFSALTAAKQPMKPTMVRWVLSGRPAARMIWKSRPGAEKPVQLATIRWVTPSGSSAADRLHREVKGVRLIQRHALGGGGESAAAVEAGGVEDLVARLRPGLEDGVAMLDVGQARHAVEQRALVPVRERCRGRTRRRRRGCRAAGPRWQCG